MGRHFDQTIFYIESNNIMKTTTKVSTPKVSSLVTALGLTASKRATKKPSIAVVALNSEDTMNLVSTYANAFTEGLKSVEKMNVVIQSFIDHKVTFVKLTATKQKDTLAYKFTSDTKNSFTKAFKKANNTPDATIAQYWKTFFNAVNNKKLATGLDATRNKNDQEVDDDGKVIPKAKVEKAILTYFNSIAKHSEFKKLPVDLKIEIEDYLKLNGEEAKAK